MVISTDEISSNLNGRNLHFFVGFVIIIVETDNSSIFVLLHSETHLCSYKRRFVVKFTFLKLIKTIKVKQ